MLPNKIAFVLEVARHHLHNLLFLTDAADPNFTRATGCERSALYQILNYVYPPLFTKQSEHSPAVSRLRVYPGLWLEVLETSSDLQIGQALIRSFALDDNGSLPGSIDDMFGVRNRGISNDLELRSVRPSHHHVTTTLWAIECIISNPYGVEINNLRRTFLHDPCPEPGASSSQPLFPMDGCLIGQLDSRSTARSCGSTKVGRRSCVNKAEPLRRSKRCNPDPCEKKYHQ